MITVLIAERCYSNHFSSSIEDCSKVRNIYGMNREEEIVFMLLMRGASNKSISKHLFMSERSVKNCLTSIFRKMKVTNRTQAVMKGMMDWA